MVLVELLMVTFSVNYHGLDFSKPIEIMDTWE